MNDEMKMFEERIKIIETHVDQQAKRIDKLENTSFKFGEDMKILAQSTKQAMTSLNEMLVAINKVIFGTNYASEAPHDNAEADDVTPE